MTPLYIEDAMQLIDAIRNKFLSGVESIALVKDKEIVFSPAACEKFLKKMNNLLEIHVTFAL